MRIVRRLTHAVLLVLTLIVGAAAAAVIVSQTAWFRDWLRGYIVREAHQYLNGNLSIERLGGNLFFGVELENIGLSMDGSEVVAVKDLGLDYNAFQLIAGGLSLDNIRLNKPIVYLRREGDIWSISRVIKKQAQEADRRGPASPLAIDQIEVTDGSVVFEQPVGTSGVEVPRRVDHLDAQLSFRYEPVHYSVEITRVSFRGSDPGIGLNALSGGVAIKDDTLFVDKLQLRTEETSLAVDGAIRNYLTTPELNLQISSDKLSLPEIARLVPALAGVRLQPAFEVHLSGPSDRLAIGVNVRSPAGQLAGDLVADLAAPGQSVQGTLSVRHLDLAPILDEPAQTSDITANAALDVSGASLSDTSSWRGSVQVDAPRIVAAGFAADHVKGDAKINGRSLAVNVRGAAYGATATAAGRVTIPAGKEPLTYDLRGQGRRVDLRRLPPALKVPPAATNVNADYRIKGVGSAFVRTDADLEFLDSIVAGTKIASGGRVSVSVDGQRVGYQADVHVAGLDLQQMGNAFNVAPLAAERYRSSINGHIVANGEGTKPEQMRVDATGILVDSAILGGRVPRMAFDAAVADDTARVKANGSIAGFDPAVLSGKPAMKGEVSGAIVVDATFAGVSAGVTPESVRAGGTITLQPSTIGGLAIDSANIDGDYRDSTGVIRSFEVKGRDVNATASGTLALNDTGQSNLIFHADSPSLDEIGKLVDTPLRGIGTVEGTITGNARELRADGAFIGDGVAYGEASALTMRTKYTVKIPELTLADANVKADTAATFVTIAEQNVNELRAQTDYANKHLSFDLTARQPQRSLGASGSLLLHPDHREVHLEQVTLQAQATNWTLLPGFQPTIQYRDTAVAIENLVLASGNQQLTVEGKYGQPGDEMQVTASNVDLASVDALLLRSPQFTGHLDASATVTTPLRGAGERETPRVTGEFAVNQGGFRDFKYDTFGGTADYRGTGIHVDARLQQNPTTWLTAKGYVPMAVFKGNAAGRHVESVAAADRIDLHVESTPIDLGILQGFTTALTKVTGTLQATLDVTGTAGDPHPIGAVTVRDAAFTVEPTGVVYTDFDARIDLQADRVHIEEIKVLDGQRKPLTVTGDLAVHEWTVGGVSLAVKAADFKIIDNEMGNVRITSDLRVAGDLAQPRIEGDLGVTTGVINLDPILAAAGESAYATEPTEFAAPAQAKGQAGTPKPSAYEAMQIDVNLAVPNDLVIRGQNLQPPGSPIGLGSLTATLGGRVYVSKAPYDQVRLSGAVNTVRGSYTFQGRRFDILRDGAVRFEGLDDLDPSLDVRTQRTIRAVVANVNIRGTLKNPKMELSSAPPLEEADILALIVFNQPVNQLGEGQQIALAQRARALAVGAAASEVAQSIGRALNVDTFEINTAPDNGASAEFTIGRQVGQNLYVKLQQGVGDRTATNVILEYEVANWLRLQTNVLQGSTAQQLFQRMRGSGADLLFFFSY